MSARLRDSDLVQLRVPPQSVEAEQAVIGGLMLAPESLGRVADKLTDADFYRRDHQLIYRAICELDRISQPYDAVTVGEWFEAQGLASQIDLAYLIELASTTPSAANIMAYAAIVRDKSTLRKIIEISTEAVNSGFNPDGRDTPAILDEVIRSLMALSKLEQRCEYTLTQALSLAFDDALVAYQNQGQLRGVPTGYTRMDDRLGGWHPGDLIFIGARPSMGKTALMVNLGANAAARGNAVGIISGEQSAMQIGQRSISSESGVHAELMRNGHIEDEAWPKLTAATGRLKERKIHIYDRSAPTLDEVARVARRWKQEHGIKVLFVDYLQRIRFPKAQNRIDEVSEIARGLKTLARDLDIAVVCLAQVKADVDKREDKRPGLGDIANSDEATREADMIVFLYRDEVYFDETTDRSIAELNVEKYRHGPTGRFRLRFDGATMRFSNLEERNPFE